MKIIGEYKPIKRGKWRDLSIPVYSKLKQHSQIRVTL